MIQIAAVGLVVVSAAVLMGACTGSRGGATHSDDAAGSLRFDADDIGGVVRSSDGPEAGVWVIAETTDLPTKFAKIVVTDDLGRYVLPDLPKARYVLWVRGYGLVDSAKIEAIPGYRVDLRALKAPDERAAAQVYPAIYWYAMLQIPPPSEFGGKGTLPANVSMAAYLNLMKNNGCIGCHQLGQLSTRTLPAAFAQLGAPGSHHDAWIRRVQSGQSGEQMIN